MPFGLVFFCSVGCSVLFYLYAVLIATHKNFITNKDIHLLSFLQLCGIMQKKEYRNCHRVVECHKHSFAHH